MSVFEFVAVALCFLGGVMMQTTDYCTLCKDHIACNNDGVSHISFYAVDQGILDQTKAATNFCWWIHLKWTKLNNTQPIDFFRQSFASTCSPDVKQIEITPDRQNIILSIHNDKRNIVAKGELPGYETASRMGVVVITTWTIIYMIS